MPLQQTSGAASYDAFGGGAPVAAKYIEDFFQTWLRTGTGSSLNVPTGLNGAINETMVWTKSRSAATNHKLTDNVRGATKALSSNTTGAEVTDSQGLTAFSSTGYTIGTNTDYNNSGATYVDWQWVATPKFFDVIVHTAGTPVVMNHNLGSVPGCIISKGTTAADFWSVVHRGTNGYTFLNATDAADGIYQPGIGASTASAWVGATATTVDFSNFYNANTNFVAYLFAHNAGGFGLTGTDNVISCGSYVGNGSASGPIITLGYEPQWIMVKDTTDSVQDWVIQDVMRGMTVTAGEGLYLRANSSAADAANSYFTPLPTGFQPNQASGQANASGRTYIYIAIRRGPMRVPTTGTSVFATQGSTAPSPPSWHSTNFPVDLGFWKNKINASGDWNWGDRLRGGAVLNSNNTNAEVANTQYKFDYQEGWYNGSALGDNYPSWMFRRAPGFFDEVCYTGTGVARTVAHNLGVAPELMIVKNRGVGTNWAVYASALGSTKTLFLNLTNDPSTITGVWNDTAPTSSVFTVGNVSATNNSANTYVAYLFSSCPGVSKVGSYTGTGTTQTINCGFTAGSRFIMIKRTDSTGSWYVWDSARGIVAGNDPYLLLNSSAAEVTNTDFVDTAATGFEISSTAPAEINASGGTFIFLAVA